MAPSTSNAKRRVTRARSRRRPTATHGDGRSSTRTIERCPTASRATRRHCPLSRTQTRRPRESPRRRSEQPEGRCTVPVRRHRRSQRGHAPRLHAPADLGQVRGPRGVLGQKMKHGSVVPEVDTAVGKQWRRHVADHPLRHGAALPEAFLCGAQTRIGKIDHRDVAVPSGEEIVDERGSASTNVDETCVECEARRADERQRVLEVRPVPAPVEIFSPARPGSAGAAGSGRAPRRPAPATSAPRVRRGAAPRRGRPGRPRAGSGAASPSAARAPCA
jgi:hypothetical protein